MIPHGQRSKYIHDGCRCELCKSANARYNKARQRAREPRQTGRPRAAYDLPTIPLLDTTWMDDAACRGRSDLYFPANGSGHSNSGHHQQARTICSGCPVINECRQYALAINPAGGVWAGLTANELNANPERTVA